jgi:transposase
MRFDLSDEEWSVLEPLMPKSRKSARPHDRRIINAIFYVLRTGIPWRDLPERYGPYAGCCAGATSGQAAAAEQREAGMHMVNGKCIRTPARRAASRCVRGKTC